MIVVDTDLITYLFVEADRTAEAEAVLKRDPIWVAPVLWRSEFRNTLATLVRRNALTLGARWTSAQSFRLSRRIAEPIRRITF